MVPRYILGHSSTPIAYNMITFKNISYEIDKSFPEFKETLDPRTYTDEDRDRVYVYVNQFGHYFMWELAMHGDKSPLVKNIFKFINNNYNTSKDEKVLSVIRITFFDKLKEDVRHEELSKLYFTDKTLEDFLEF